MRILAQILSIILIAISQVSCTPKVLVAPTSSSNNSVITQPSWGGNKKGAASSELELAPQTPLETVDRSVESAVISKDQTPVFNQQTPLDSHREILTIAVIPDTQHYSERFPNTFVAITSWISDNWLNQKFDFVLHLGDIVNNPNHEQEWINARNAMSLLHGQVFAVLPGNHDFDHDANGTNNYTYFNKYFTPDLLPSHDKERYFPSGTMINNYIELQKYLILNIGFFHGDPSGDLNKWIESVLSQKSNKQVIIVTHDFLLPNGELSYSGAKLWNIFQNYPDVFLILSGHAWVPNSSDKQEKIKTLTGAQGNTVAAIMSNYQDYLGNNSGYFRIYEITNSVINAKTFSPLYGYLTDNSSQFNLMRRGASN